MQGKPGASSNSIVSRAVCWLIVGTALGLSVGGCGGGANVESCEPAGSCSCGPGTERATSCKCSGGSECSIEGDDIEFGCDGNADCSLDCGTHCLVTCPGTTTCEVGVDDEGVIECPGTAHCVVTCRGSCSLEMRGSATSLLTCAADDADCSMRGCEAVDCGEGVFACGVDCPAD